MEKTITLEEVKNVMVGNAAEFIVKFAAENGVWTDWDNSKLIEDVMVFSSEKNGVDYGKLYEEQNEDTDIWEELEWFEIYQEALEKAKKNFKYMLVLAQKDAFGNVQSADIWYGNNKNLIAERVYDDCVGFECSDEKYTVEQLLNMIETV